MKIVKRLLFYVVAAAAVAGALAGGSGALPSGDNAIVTVTGLGGFGDTGDGEQATEAQINRPRSLETDFDGGYVFAEPWSHRVRRVGSDGRIATIAGTGVAGYSGDGGPAWAAQVNFVHAASPMPGGGYVISDELNNRIRRIWPDGTITTVAGNGAPGFSGDGGPATAAAINNPRGVAALSDGGFLIPDSNNHRVRRVWPNGTITTVAGTGAQGYSGDGGPATAAALSIPFAVSPTPGGGFLIVDIGNERIRKVATNGTITTVAGNGTSAFSGDGGPATAASLWNPHNVAVLADGSFLIADTSNQRVRYVALDGKISTVAGTGSSGFSGDGGPAKAAMLNAPKGVAVTPAGDFLVADEQNSRVRFVGVPIAPTNMSPPSLSGTASEGSSLTAAAGGWSGTGPVVAYQWRRCDAQGASCSNIAGATAKTYGVTSGDVGGTIRVQVTASNAAGSATASSDASGVVTSTPTPPANVSAPVITGTAQQGQTLTANPGSWSGTQPISYAYQWRRCDGQGAGCANIAGAAQSTYVLQAADVGFTLRVRVTASNAVGSSLYASRVNADTPRSYWRFGETSGSALADARGFKNGTVLGGVQRGTAGLVATDSDPSASFDGSSGYADVPADAVWTPQAFSIEVLVEPSELPANKTIWSTMGGSTGFAGWWLNTGPTGVIRMFIGNGSAWRFDSSGPALQAGSPYHLVATYDGALARVYVNGALVSTGPSTTMAPNVAGNVMRFGAYSTGPGQFWPGVIDDASFYPSALSATQVTSHYQAMAEGSTASSTQTAVVTQSSTPPANTTLPTISGSAQEGAMLTANSGTWSGTPPISYVYQWRRCDSAGSGCANIAGANASTYTVTAADVSSTIRVQVTATNAAGSATAS